MVRKLFNFGPSWRGAKTWYYPTILLSNYVDRNSPGTAIPVKTERKDKKLPLGIRSSNILRSYWNIISLKVRFKIFSEATSLSRKILISDLCNNVIGIERKILTLSQQKKKKANSLLHVLFPWYPMMTDNQTDQKGKRKQIKNCLFYNCHLINFCLSSQWYKHIDFRSSQIISTNRYDTNLHTSYKKSSNKNFFF